MIIYVENQTLLGFESVLSNHFAHIAPLGDLAEVVKNHYCSHRQHNPDY